MISLCFNLSVDDPSYNLRKIKAKISVYFVTNSPFLCETTCELMKTLFVLIILTVCIKTFGFEVLYLCRRKFIWMIHFQYFCFNYLHAVWVWKFTTLLSISCIHQNCHLAIIHIVKGSVKIFQPSFLLVEI